MSIAFNQDREVDRHLRKLHGNFIGMRAPTFDLAFTAEGSLGRSHSVGGVGSLDAEVALADQAIVPCVVGDGLQEADIERRHFIIPCTRKALRMRTIVSKTHPASAVRE